MDSGGFRREEPALFCFVYRNAGSQLIEANVLRIRGRQRDGDERGRFLFHSMLLLTCYTTQGGGIRPKPNPFPTSDGDLGRLLWMKKAVEGVAQPRDETRHELLAEPFECH